MHKSEYSLKGYVDPVVVWRHGDWSGDVTIEFKELPLNEMDKRKYDVQEVTIPAALLVAIALPATNDMMSVALKHFAERLPQTLGLMTAIEDDEAERKPKKPKKPKRKGKR